MSHDDDPVPLIYCTAPGSIKVTQRALGRAEQFQASIPGGWMVAFMWYDGQKKRASKEAPWIDVGPGLGLGTFRIGDIPEVAIYHAGSFRYAVIIQKEIVEQHPQKTIDLDERGNPIFL